MAFIPAILFGVGATAAAPASLFTGAVAASAATSGIIGAGGALTAGGIFTLGSAGLSAASTMMQMKGARDAGKSEAALYAYNAALDRREAQQRRTASLDEQNIRRKQMRRELQSQRATIAKGGTTMSGSNLLIQLESAEVMSADIASLAYGRELEAVGLATGAGLKDYSAGAAERAGRLGVGTALVGGISDISRLGIQHYLTQQEYA